MTEQEARDFLARVFQVLLDPAATAEEVGTFFTPDYVQNADGKVLHRPAFIDHVRVLKAALQNGTATLEKVIVGGATIATLHRIDAHKRTGETVQVKVHAFFEIEHGLIRRTEELTHLLAGAEADRDLGSRTSG
jgi:ketosteroid isomerase-like protein